MKHAWSGKGASVEVLQVAAHLKRTVVMSAISKTGRVFTHTKDSYFRKEDVVHFLRGLRQVTSGRKIAVFWDNASVHRAYVAQ